MAITIYDAPAEFSIAALSLQPLDSVATSRSIYDGAEKRVDFGGAWWSLQVTVPVRSWESAAPLLAWATLLRRENAVARIGLERVFRRLGTVTTLTATAKTASATLSRSVTLQGLGARKVLTAGSLIKGPDGQLHQVQIRKVANSSGEATINVWPHFRAAVSAGATFTLGGAVSGLWRLDESPALSWDVSQWGTNFGQQTFKFTEAVSR